MQGLELLPQPVDASCKLGVGHEFLFGPSASVHDGRVISIAEEFTDGLKGGVGRLADQIHGEPPRANHRGLARRPSHRLERLP